MTILLPHPRPPHHKCDTPDPLRCVSSCSHAPAYLPGALWECPACGRWWKCRTLKAPDPRPLEVYYGGSPYNPMWHPVRWYDIPARRRIADHETAKILLRRPGHTGALHWWDCHPNPKRGRA